MGNIKQINITNRTYYFFNDISNVKDKEKWTKNHTKYWYLSHWIHHNKKIDDYENIHNVNPLYFIIDKADGYIEEGNGNRYLTLFLQTKTKKYWLSTQNFGINLNIWLRK